MSINRDQKSSSYRFGKHQTVDLSSSADEESEHDTLGKKQALRIKQIRSDQTPEGKDGEREVGTTAQPRKLLGNAAMALTLDATENFERESQGDIIDPNTTQVLI